MIEARTGIDDDLEGPNAFLASWGQGSIDVCQLCDALGERFEITRTNIEKYSVGSPIRAPIECLRNIMAEHSVGPGELAEMIVYTARGEDQITRSDQHMSNLNLRYLLAATLIDGALSFRSAHDEDRVGQPDIKRVAAAISIRANLYLATVESPRQGSHHADRIKHGAAQGVGDFWVEL